MDLVVLTVFATMLIGAPQGILLILGGAVIAATVRWRGTPRERARGMLRMGFLWASVVFTFISLVLGDWQGVAILWLITAFIVNARRSHGAMIDRDRLGLAARFLAAVAGLAMAWLLINWVTTPTAVWLVAVALLAGGVFAMTLRWSTLPWSAGTVSRARTFGLVTTVAMSTLITGLAFV